MKRSVISEFSVIPKNISWITAKRILKSYILTALIRFLVLLVVNLSMDISCNFKLQTTYSNLHYFLLFTTDRSEKINRYLGYVNISTVNISEATFETKENVSFDTSKLGFSCQEKEIMNNAVAKMLNKIIDMSNANLAKNADSLLSKKNVEVNVE